MAEFTGEYKLGDNGEVEEVIEVVEEEPDWQYVLGMDPGGTTGIAMLRYTEDLPPELIYLHQIKDGQEGFLDWFEGSETSDNLDIVSENFTIREGVHGADVTPLRIEGIQYALWRDEVTYQDPSMKSLIKDDWLKEQNLWTPGKRHQMDALIHALVFLRNNDHKPTLESLSGKAEEKLEEEGGAEQKQYQEQPQGTPDEDGEQGTPSDEGDESAAGEGDSEGAGEGDEAQGSADGQGEGDGWGEGSGQPAGQPTKVEIDEVHQGGRDANGAEAHDGSWIDIPDFEPQGKRKRREIGGTFAGYDPAESTNEKTLLDD